jgi:hypothetical protein
MTKDAFGHEVKFGTRMIVGRPRKDAKYPVKFIFLSSGTVINKVMTKDALDADIQDSRRRGTEPDVIGYAKPPRTQAQLDRDIAKALEDR